MVIKMKVRLGYVALSKALDDVTTSSTITYTNYINKNYNTSKLLEITKNNLDSLYEIIKDKDEVKSLSDLKICSFFGIYTCM